MRDIGPAEVGDHSSQTWLDALLRNLDPDPERATQRYSRVWRRLEVYFDRRRCNDAYVLVHECLTRLGKRLLEGPKVDSIESYTFGIARWVYSEYLRGAVHQITGDEDLRFEEPADDTDTEKKLQEELDAEKLRKCIEMCVPGLPPLDREILALCSCEDAPGLAEARSAIASELGINESDVNTPEAKKRLVVKLGTSEGALKKRVYDIRGRLRERVDNCMNAGKKR